MMLVASRSSYGISLDSINIQSASPSEKGIAVVKSKSLWKANSDHSIDDTDKDIRIVSVLPLELDMLILGLCKFPKLPSLYRFGNTHAMPANGKIAITSFEAWSLRREISCPKGKQSFTGLDHPILSLDPIRNSRTRERYILGSASEGSVAVWRLK